MKNFAWVLFPLLQSLTSSCDIRSFSAGSYPYAESVTSNCRRDYIISKLTSLKSDSKYNNTYSFPDGPNESPSPYYSFYFFSSENNCIVHMAVGPGFDKNAALLIVGIKEAYSNSPWVDFNHGLVKDRQKKIMTWFNKEIQPSIICEKGQDGNL
ncbi:hypothetical protein GCM10027422_46980 [Hymenobacter arcticus]